jgi:hypothetical protein
MACLNHPGRDEAMKVELCAECIVFSRLCARANPALISDIRNGIATLAAIQAVLQDVQPDLDAPMPEAGVHVPGKVFGVIARGPEGKQFWAFAHLDPTDPSVAVVGRQADKIRLADLVSVHASADAARRAYYRYKRLGSKAQAK